MTDGWIYPRVKRLWTMLEGRMVSLRERRGIGGMVQQESKSDAAVDPRTAVDEREIGPLGANMQTINIHEARTHLFRLVDAAALDEEIVIVRDGKPVARLLCYPCNMIGFRAASAL
jgi:prevent-host-death family protein